MCFGWSAYIIGLAAITAAIVFWGSYSTFVLVSLIVLLLVWLFLIPIIIGKRAIAAYEQLPELTTKATIVSKEIIIEHTTMPSGEGDFYESETTYHNIKFEVEDRNQWVFDVSKELFDALAEGDNGMLVYKESEQQRYFISFTR